MASFLVCVSVPSFAVHVRLELSPWPLPMSCALCKHAARVGSPRRWMEQTALSLQSFRGPRPFLFVSSLAHVVRHMWGLGSLSRSGALWPPQGEYKSPEHWASRHVNTSFSLQISGGWGATGGPFRAGRAVTGPQPALPPPDGRPARAPSAQSAGVTPLHCLGVPTGPLSVRERPPTSSGRCHGPPSPGW